MVPAQPNRCGDTLDYVRPGNRVAISAAVRSASLRRATARKDLLSLIQERQLRAFVFWNAAAPVGLARHQQPGQISVRCAGSRSLDRVGRCPNVWLRRRKLWQRKLWNDQRRNFSVSRRTGLGLNADWARNAEPFKLGNLCPLALAPATARFHSGPEFAGHNDPF